MYKNFVDQFTIQAKSNLNKSAIIFNEQLISYYDLNLRSDHLAQHLLSLDINDNKIIPLILERNESLIISMLGTLKAGCAFLPISPITPCSRIKFILEDTNAKHIISNMELEHVVGDNINIINPTKTLSSKIISNTQSPNKPHHLAYVMYTSGSTGNPKGVLIQHGSMMNLFTSLINKLNITDRDQFIALTDYTFDISLIELLMPLLQGATLILTEQGTVADGSKIRKLLEKNTISIMQATPLTWEILLKQGWKNNNSMKILVGGEKFKTSLAESLNYKNGNIWNMYGPTETSMWSMCYPLKDEISTESVPLGNPLDNTIVKILDSDLAEVKKGAQGELYIGGDGLARGYLNNNNLTQEKFILHPKTNERLYKTGDLVVQHTTETICYLGRTDDQLKFGGIRIEAGEIEAFIEQEPLVKKAVVKIHENEGYYKSLAAYIEIDEQKIFSNEIHSTNLEVSNFLKNIYDETYLHAEEFEHGLINNCGWQSSFTGQLFNIAELNESFRLVRKIIKESNLSNVLEVGCGTGSLLLEYIDKTEQCTVVEISSKAIDYVKRKLNSEQKKKTIFRNESILNVHDHQKYTCIIVNSVVQYLPSIDVLITSIKQLVDSSKASGTIIIGDVRSLELMELYILEKIRLNSTNEKELSQHLNSFYYKSRDAEIVLSPKFFYVLKNIIPDISHVDIAVKHGDYVNELNYFRYDVILHIKKPIQYQSPLIIEYKDTLNIEELRKLSLLNAQAPILVKNIPNGYTQKLLKKLNSVLIQMPINANDIQYENQKTYTQELLSCELTTHDKYVNYEQEKPLGALELWLYPKSTAQLIRSPNIKEEQPYTSYCREPFNPWIQRFCFEHIKLKISQNVLSWVNPSVYIWIERWPSTINGKLDKKKLNLPLSSRIPSEESNLIEKLQMIWRNITGDDILLDKEFWVHGVSSLCMYFFLATINEAFLININYHEFRDYNTLEKLAKYIEELLDLPEN